MWIGDEAGTVQKVRASRALRASQWYFVAATYDADASAVQAHQVAVSAEHNLLHALPRLAAALVHADPQPRQGDDHHAVLASHR